MNGPGNKVTDPQLDLFYNTTHMTPVELKRIIRRGSSLLLRCSCTAGWRGFL